MIFNSRSDVVNVRFNKNGLLYCTFSVVHGFFSFFLIGRQIAVDWSLPKNKYQAVKETSLEKTKG